MKIKEVIIKVENWFTPKRRIYILVGIGIMALVLFLSTCDSCRSSKFHDQQVENLTKENLKLNLEKQQLIQDTNKLGQTVSKQEVIIVSTQGDLKKLTQDYFNLKSKDNKRIKQVNALFQEKTSTGISNTDIPYEEDDTMAEDSPNQDSVGIPCDSLSYVHVPIKANVDSPYFKFQASIEKKGLHIDSISFPDSLRFALIETKGGLFKRDMNNKLHFHLKPTLEVQALHTSPYVKTQGLSSVIYQPKPKGRWLERVLILLAGATATYFIIK